MTHLATHLERLGLEQYLDAFIAEGFDTWETLLDIQESDLDQLNVKLGHRRKLQRAIADFRGISYDRLLGSPIRENQSEPSRLADPRQGEGNADEGHPAEGPPDETNQGTAPPLAETKRKYRRHPKPDESAPEKPPSAYVLFSNMIREHVKSENLSFTEIAKLVGERWQKLDPSQKEPFEAQAQALKASYHIQLSAYKKTDAYKEYSQYLAEFKAKHGQMGESKRPRLDPQSSGGSTSVASVASQEGPEVVTPVPTHVRGSSVGSINTVSTVGPLATPIALPSATSLPEFPVSGGFPTISQPQAGSPPVTQPGWDRWRIGQISTQSPTADDPTQLRSDIHDPLSRAATLSLNTPPAVTSPLPTSASSLSRPEPGIPAESFPWQPPRHPPPPPVRTSPHGTRLTLLSSTLASELLRDRASDVHRSPPVSLMQPSGFSTSMPLPPILNPDRLPDLSRAQAQRTLPPLRQYSAATTTQPDFSPLRIAPSTNQVAPWPTSGVESHDNEAANTLAGLANRSSNDHLARHDDARQ